MTIYKAKEHVIKNDAYDWKWGQPTSVTCHLAYQPRAAYTI